MAYIYRLYNMNYDIDHYRENRNSRKSLKTIKNYPKYLLAPHDFMYSADIIMPAMERLDEKCLHKVSFRPLNRVFSFTGPNLLWWFSVLVGAFRYRNKEHLLA